MYAKFSFQGSGEQQTKKLKQHHHVRLDSEFKDHCKVWLDFLKKGNLSVCRPFVDLESIQFVEHIGFATDAAKGEKLGYGGIIGKKWLFAQWEPNYIKKYNPSIAYLELLGLVSAVFAWIQYLKNR